MTEMEKNLGFALTDKQKRIIEGMQKIFEERGVEPTDHLLLDLYFFFENEKSHELAEFVFSVHDEILEKARKNYG